MKEIVTIKATIVEEARSHQPDWESKLMAALKPLGPIKVERSPYNPYFFTFLYDHYLGELEQIQEYLREYGIRVSIYVRREYTPEELLAAEFLELGTEAVVSSVQGTLKWHNEPVCPHCGFEDDVWDLHSIRVEEKPEGYQIAKVDWHPKVVSATLAETLRSANLTGLELIPLGDEAPLWYALQAPHILPAMAVPPTRFRATFGVKITPQCSSDHKWARPHSPFYYHREGFVGYDFNQTYELFGGTGTADRALIISNRVWRLLLELGVQQLRAEPIRFVESGMQQLS